MTGLLTPQEIIQFFLDNDGKSTNVALVKHFEKYINSDRGPTNKMILKKVTGHIATVRKQGSRLGFGELRDSGKVILLKKRFSKRTSGDIWASLILTLPQEERNFIVYGSEEMPIQKKPEIDSNLSSASNSNFETGVRQCIYFPGQDGTTLEQLEAMKDDNVVAMEEPEIEVIAVEAEPPVIECVEPSQQVRSKPEDDGMEDKLWDKDMQASKSVKDLTQSFENKINEMSLPDHHKIKQEPNTPGRRRKIRPSTKPSEDIHLTPRDRDWLFAALRQDYHKLSRLAHDDPSIVAVRDPANGYTALHFAARRGDMDMVKLLAGKYALEPDLRSRGGYTPLMLAGMAKQHEVFDVLVKTYGANEDLRDYSGHTAVYYLENHIQVPGFSPDIEMSHDVVLDRDVTDSGRVRHKRRGRDYFIRGIKDSLIGSGIRLSLRDSFKESFSKDAVMENLRAGMFAGKTRPKSTSSFTDKEDSLSNDGFDL